MLHSIWELDKYFRYTRYIFVDLSSVRKGPGQYDIRGDYKTSINSDNTLRGFRYLIFFYPLKQRSKWPY